MVEDGFKVRTMTRDDFDRALDWAAAEGWNPGLADADCFLAPDPAGFLLGEIDGVPVSCISVVRYGPDYGFLGFYICPPEHRGKGYGFRVWQAGMARLGNRVVGLDGVPDQQSNYRKSGYVLAHRNVRYGGRVMVDPQGVAADLVDVTAVPFVRLLAYDRPFFPAPREPFLRCWLRSDRRSCLVALSEGAIAGYGVIRECREGFKIGPLFADGPGVADRLFRGLALATGGEPLYLDTPETNGAAVALARRYGLEPCFETARMYRGNRPILPLDRTFGITSFELG